MGSALFPRYLRDREQISCVQSLSRKSLSRAALGTASGWTWANIPKVHFGGQPLDPKTGFTFYGLAATNLDYRIVVLWGLNPAEARARPKWHRAVDGWCERIGIRPIFLPYGIIRSPVVPARSPKKP
jgi:hypothetical protein